MCKMVVPRRGNMIIIKLEQILGAFSDENLKTVYRDDNKKQHPDLTIDWI